MSAMHEARKQRATPHLGPLAPSMQCNSPVVVPCLQVAPLLPQVFRQLGGQRLQHNHAQLWS